MQELLVFKQSNTCVTEIPKEDSMKQNNIWRNNDPEFSKFYGRHNATDPRNSEKK